VAAGLERCKLIATGSLLRVIACSNHPLAHGAPREVAVLLSNGPAFRAQKGRAVLTYPPQGFCSVNDEGYLREQAALGEVR